MGTTIKKAVIFLMSNGCEWALSDAHGCDIKMLVLESRLEYVTESNVKEIKKLLSNKHVEIAMGLELKDDIYRSVCFNKGFSLKNYNDAAAF